MPLKPFTVLDDTFLQRIYIFESEYSERRMHIVRRF